MPTTHELLKKALLETDDSQYALIRLPANGIMAAAGVIAQVGEPFSAMIVDRHEVSLVIPHDLVEDFRDRFREYELASPIYLLITFDVVTELDTIGFMALIARSLAEAGIPIMPFASFTRDHILVQAAHFDHALQTLHDMQKNL